MWSIVSSMKLLRKPSKRGEGDIERNKGSTVSLKDHSKEASISHLDSDAQVNLDPSCSTDTNVSSTVALNGNIVGKSATLGSTSTSSSNAGLNTGTKVKVERRESARLASSATKFLRSLRNHSGGGKLATSSVIAADDKHPINVIALKELDIDTHSLNPGAASTSSGIGFSGASGPRGGAGQSGKLPERSQSFNEKRLLVVTQNSSSENSAGSSSAAGNSAPVKVKHSRAQSFVCNNSSSRNKSGYSIYLNHQHQYQSNQQNQANLVKQQLLFDQSKHQNNSSAGSNDGSRSNQQHQLQHHSSVKSSGGNKADAPNVSGPEPTSVSSAARVHSLQSCETIYENLEVILEEKQNKEQLKNKTNIPCNKDYSKIGNISQSTVPASSKSSPSAKSSESQHDASSGTADTDRNSTEVGSGSSPKVASSSSESLNANMRISGKDRSCQFTRKYNKDSGYETSCSDYSNINLPKSSSVDSIISSRIAADKQYHGITGDRSHGASDQRSNRILNTSLYEEINVSSITEDIQNTSKPNIMGSVSGSGGGRKLRRSISEVPSERNTNLAKLQTKVGDSTARAMYTIANGLTVWTTEKSNSSLGLNAGGGHSGSTQGLHQYQNVYGCRSNSQLLHPQSVPPIPGGFSAAVHQASVYSTLPRNHNSTNHSNDSFGIYRGYQYRNIPAQTLNSHQSVSQTYQNYSQIAAKSTPSLRNAVLQENQMQQKCFGDSTDENKLASSASPTATTSTVSDSSQPQQQPIYQTIPVPTLSPARSTPNLGSAGANKLLKTRPDQQQHIQGSTSQLSMVSTNHHAVNTLGKVYSKPQQLHQKPIYNHFGSSSCLSQQQQSLSSSVVQLQHLQSNDKTFAEPGRYPSTPNLQKSDSNSPFPATTPKDEPIYSDSQQQCNPSESHNIEPSSNTGSTNNLNAKSIAGAMSGSNDSATSTTPSGIGGNWNTIDAHSILNNNNNNNNSAPVRDSSSLKQIRYGPGHEKYPSWPIPVSSAQQIDPAGESHPVKLVPGSGSTRSKSWTEQTDYPKEKTPSYARPYMKRVNHSYTQQLKTVMEKCERIPPEAYASQTDPQLLNSHGIPHPAGARHGPHHHHQLPMNGGLPKNTEGAIVPPPLLYRDLMANQQNGHGNSNPMTGYNQHHQHNLHNQYYQTHMNNQQQQSSGNKVAGEKEYMVPSPPERVHPEKESTLSKPLTQEDLELYTKKYEELITQYPQSEGYHSYISSDSSSYISSGTPFLDQLRRESENNQQFWSGDKNLSIAALSGLCDPNDPLFGLIGGQLASAGVSGRESVTTVVTNSSSNSSGTETLKWHGSTSDISLSSGIGGSLHSSSLSTLGGHLKPNNYNNSSSRKNGSVSASMLNKGWNEQQQNIAHSSRLSTPLKQHATESNNSQQNGVSNLRSKLEHLHGSPSLNKWHSGSNDTMEQSGSNKNSCNNSNNNGNINNNGNNNNSGGNNPPNLKKFPLNTYTRPSTLSVDKMNSSQTSGVNSAGSSSNLSGNSSSSATSTPEKMGKLLQAFNSDASNTLKGAKSLSHSLSSPVIDTSKPPSVAERIMELEQQSHQQSSVSPSTSGTSSPKMGQGHSNDNLAFLASNFMKSSSLNNLQNSPAGMYMDESNAAPQQQQQQQQQQNEWMTASQGSRSNTISPRSFMQSLSSSNVNKVASESGNNNNAISYSYLDPDKKHKVADMTLKAIQKKALLSYYERHKGKCANTSSASSVSSSDGISSQAEGPAEKDVCFSGKSSRLMLSLPKEHTATSLDQQQQSPPQSTNNMLSSDSSRTGGTNLNPPSSSSSPSLSGLNRAYRAISVSSGVSSSSSSSRSSSASNSKVSSHSQHQQLPHGANINNSPKNIQTNTAGHSEDMVKQADKERQSTPSSSTPDTEPIEMYPGADSARLAYMSKYLPHLVNRDSTSASSGWSTSSSTKLTPGGTGPNNAAAAPVTQEPAPIPPERPPKKPHLRNLAQQVHEENKDSKPPPPLPRAPVRPPTMQNNGVPKSGNNNAASGPPPIPSKPNLSSGGLGITRSPSPDELPPPPPPPPTEEMEVLINDEPLPPPPTVSEVDVLFGSRTRSVTGLSSCLHKDSYMAQRKERTLGYEGRYRRTLSPSGLGSNNNNSKSSLESPSPGASDSAGSTRSMTNLGGGKLDSTLSPAAWEKFHNIRAPSTTVIFTSDGLAKGSGSPPSTAASSTSGSPQPPVSQPLFHRSISCDSNIFNNKTGVSQSSIPPPVAQVAPLRGSVTSSNGMESSIEKLSQMSLQKDVITLCHPSSAAANSSMQAHTNKSCDKDGTASFTAERDNTIGDLNSGSNYEMDERHFRDQMSQAHGKSSNSEYGEQKDQINSRSSNVANSALPSVIVPPLQYEKYEKDTKNGGPSLNSHHSFSESNPSLLKKSELSLHVNCTSMVTLQSDLRNGNARNQNGYAGLNGTGSFSYATSAESGVTDANNVLTSLGDGSNSKGCNLNSAVNASNSTASFYTGRQKTQEELECEELSRDIAKQLPQGDKLQTLLVPLPDHKTTADYMEGLFHLELKLQPETTERRGSIGTSTAVNLERVVSDKSQRQVSADTFKSGSQASPCPEETTSQQQKTATLMDTSHKDSIGTSHPQNNMSSKKVELSDSSNGNSSSENCNATAAVTGSPSPGANFKTQESNDSNARPNAVSGSYRRCNGHAPLPADSAYFTTSESKAKFLTQYNKDIKKEPISGTDSEELDKQKEELVSRISKKLEILRTEQLLLREEIQSNEQLGQMVVERVKQTAKRNEFDKFKLHVEEIEKITSLLLGISGRLARAENALMGLSDPPNPQEKKILESKRDKLREQLDEAKILKENIDRRSAQVSSFLQKYLTAEEYADYDHFVKMKAKLIIDAREIDDKIKLGEEQLGALKDALSTSLPLSPNNSTS